MPEKLVAIHPHALERLPVRGGTENEVRLTVLCGESFPGKLGHVGFRRNFTRAGDWLGGRFESKQYGTIYGLELLNANSQLAKGDGGNLVLVNEVLRLRRELPLAM